MNAPIRRRLASAAVLFLCAFVASTGKAFARDLTFEDRVKAQEAIERVYYSHQIGATKPFATAVPRARLELKVRTYLKQSAALERFWRTSVTGEMLGQELQRMASGSRMPDRLRELEAALGDDPFLIQETLARPALVDRLTRNFFASDATLHDKERREAEALREDLAQGRLDPRSEHPRRTVVDVVLVDEVEGAEGLDKRARAGRKNEASRLELRADEFERYRTRLSPGVSEVEKVQDEREAFVIHVPLTIEEDSMRVATFVVRKLPWDEWWASVERDLPEASVGTVARPDVSLPIIQTGQSEVFSVTNCPADDTWDGRTLDGLPSPGSSHTSIWTGSVMVVWGGSGAVNTGSRYDPATDTWTATSTLNAPQGRYSHTAVWTGSLMVVWGGHSGISFSENIRNGGRYDPATDTWTPVSMTNPPTGRIAHSAVWTGSRMIVWGGYKLRHQDPEPQIHIVTYYLNDGGQYDPATDSWTSVSTTNAPDARFRHAAVWTGSVMVVWGGGTIYGNSSTGGRYDPVTDTWTAISTTNAPSPRDGRAAVWTGSNMIIWGGTSDTSGGRYDPATDSWTSTSTRNAPSARSAHTAVWTGSRMIVWGGYYRDPPDSNSVIPIMTGGRYDPVTDTWISTSTTNAPSARNGHTAVWTGSRMIVWGATSDTTGGRYDPVTDTWTPTYSTLAPWGRDGHTVVWTGNVLVVWGGGRYSYDSGQYESPTGVRYDPATNAWTETSTTNAPSPRIGHAAVWTGNRMVVWGGSGIDPANSRLTNTGGRYDPVADTWSSTSTINAPSPRSGGRAVWTGSLMLVWAGYVDPGIFTDTGGRYDPATDTWSSMSTVNTPSARSGYTSVWAGTRLVVWGGVNTFSEKLNTGGRYDPVTDAWSPTSTTNAPWGRAGHTAVWTGSRMIVWGGLRDAYMGLYADNGGGLYDPVTDTWTPTSATNAPNARVGQSAVWTGRLMLIWGGSANQPPPMVGRIIALSPHGARYDPVDDSWTAMSSLNEPSLSGQAIWTGREMILLSSRGGRYTPSANADFYRDVDGDGHGDANDSITACAQPAGYATPNDDCDDGDPSIHPGAAELCNGRDDDCNGGIDDEPRASASCDDGDACTLDACRSGICVRTETNIPQVGCTAEPGVLNLDSNGREFGVTIVLTNQCAGRRLDPAMLAPLHLAGLSSPSLGTVILPVPDSSPNCTQDGIWETISRRTRLAPDSMRMNFLSRSDGLCSTLDGNRQDIIALLRGVPDRESVQILFASSHPGTVTPVQCGATVAILNHP